MYHFKYITSTLRLSSISLQVIELINEQLKDEMTLI